MVAMFASVIVVDLVDKRLYKPFSLSGPREDYGNGNISASGYGLLGVCFKGCLW